MARPKRKVNPLLPTPVPETKKRRVFRAGGYARLSVEDSRRPGADTIEVQKELIQNYIEAQPDMELCGLYCDNGQTGTNFERPGFEQKLERLTALWSRTSLALGATTGKPGITWNAFSPFWMCALWLSTTILTQLPQNGAAMAISSL